MDDKPTIVTALCYHKARSTSLTYYAKVSWTAAVHQPTPSSRSASIRDEQGRCICTLYAFLFYDHGLQCSSSE